MTKRDERIRELIRQYAAEFIQRNADNSSLITVTDVQMSGDAKQAAIRVTVFPVKRERPALQFLNRYAGELRNHLKAQMRTLRHIPSLAFSIDEGEKNRQRVDELSEQSDTTE